MTHLRAASTLSILFRVLVTLVLLTLVAGAGLASTPASEGDDLYKDEIGDERMVPTKAVVCNPNGYYCTGMYEELIEWTRFWHSGYGDILPTAEVRDIINSTGTCILKGGSRIEIPEDMPGAVTMIHQMNVALALEKTFRLQWIGNQDTNICELRYIIFYP